MPSCVWPTIIQNVYRKMDCIKKYPPHQKLQSELGMPKELDRTHRPIFIFSSCMLYKMAYEHYIAYRKLLCFSLESTQDVQKDIILQGNHSDTK